MNPDTMKLVFNIFAYFLIPVSFDVFIISFLLKIKRREKIIGVVLVANCLALIGRKAFTWLIAGLINPFIANVSSDQQVHYMMLIRESSVLMIGIIVLTAVVMIKIFLYRKFISGASIKDISLAVLISVLLANIVRSIGVFGFVYYIHP